MLEGENPDSALVLTAVNAAAREHIYICGGAPCHSARVDSFYFITRKFIVFWSEFACSQLPDMVIIEIFL